MNDLISIVLTTYNGEKYVKEQIDSILNQTWKEWELIIVDDASSDDTVASIQKKYARFIGKNFFIYKNRSNIGVARSFEKGLHHTHGKYIAVCNHDNIWLSNKLEKQCNAIKKFGCSLVYTDMAVVDRYLNTLSKSHKKSYLSFLVNPRGDFFEELIHENHISAPSIMFDARLKTYLTPFSKFGYEDNWIALHAAMHGSIQYIDEQTTLYRQHETNQLGANRFTVFSLLRPEENFLEKHIAKKKKYTAFLKDLMHSKNISYYHQFLVARKIYNHELLVKTLQRLNAAHLREIFIIIVRMIKASGIREAMQVVYFYTLTRVFYEKK